MLTFILALAVVLALGAVGYLSTKHRSFKEVEPSTTGGRWLYRGLACLSMAVSAALLYALYRAYRVPVEPGDFYIATDWKGFGVFVFILWLCLSGLVCFIATNAIMGGYVSGQPSRKRGVTPQQRASLAAARWASEVAEGNPLVPLCGFVIISLPCLVGIGVMQRRHVCSTEEGLAHQGIFDLRERVLPWDQIAGLSVVRVDDPDALRNVRWNLAWSDAAGNELMYVENRNVWRLMPHTINAAVAHHQARGIAVDDPRPPGDK